MEKQKILIIASRKKGFEQSGVGKYILPYAKELKKSGFQVDFMFQPEHHGLVTGIIWRFFSLPKILAKKFSNHIKIFYDESFLISIRKNIGKSSIAICHHTYKIPIGSIFDLPGIFILYIGYNFFLKNCRYAIGVSQDTIDTIVANKFIKKEKIFLAPNTFDIKYKKPSVEGLKKYNLPKNKKIILLVASTGKRKNVETAIRLLSKLNDSYILVRIGGTTNNSSQKNIDTIIRKNNLSDRYFVFNHLSTDEINSFYQSSYCLICPSLHEGFGRPVIEAQIHKLPVISTDKGGLREVCGNATIKIFSPTNIQEYLDAIYSLEDTNLRHNIIQKGTLNTQKFSIENNKDAFIRIIEKF